MKRFLIALAAIGLFVLGIGAAYWQETLLWQRISANAFDRYAPDLALPVLPGKMSRADFNILCPGEPRKLTDCLGSPPTMIPSELLLQQASKQFSMAIQQQIDVANAIGALPQDHVSVRDYRDLGGGLREKALRAPTAHLGAFGGLSIDPVDADADSVPIKSLQNVIRRIQERTTTEYRKATDRLLAADVPLARWESVRDLALLAAGLRLHHDFGTHPPAPVLVTDRGLLGEQLEWLRRANQNAANQAVSQTYSQALQGIALSGAIAVLTAIVVNTSPILVACVPVLLSAGWLMLADLGTGGPISLRYLAILQFKPVGFPVGTASWPVFVPLLAFSLGMAALKISRHHRLRSIWQPVERWVATGSALLSTLSGLILLVFAALLVLARGYSAGISEILIAIGVVAIAMYVARHAAFADSGGGIGYYTLPVLLIGAIAAAGASLARGDLGHFAVAASLLSTFLFLFLRPGQFIFAGVAFLGGLWLLLGRPADVESMIDQLERYKPHAAARLRLYNTPFDFGPSDLARLNWLQASSGDGGWGIGYSPWLGFPGSRATDGLPLQAPSDYIFTVAQSIWGWNGAWLLIAMTIGVFTRATWLGFRGALGDGYRFHSRFIASIGAFGCLAVLVKTLLSVAGTTGVLPLTGVPIALLSYGPTAMWSALGYLALAISLPESKENEA